MALEAKGTIHQLGDTVEVSDRFRKREFVVSIADNPKYPQLVQFQVTGDRCSLLNSINVGDEVRIEFNLRGREWKKPGTTEVKYFNSLDAWLIDVTKAAPAPSGGWGAPPDDDQADIPFADCSIAADPSPIAPVLRRLT